MPTLYMTEPAPVPRPRNLQLRRGADHVLVVKAVEPLHGLGRPRSVRRDAVRDQDTEGVFAPHVPQLLRGQLHVLKALHPHRVQQEPGRHVKLGLAGETRSGRPTKNRMAN